MLYEPLAKRFMITRVGTHIKLTKFLPKTVPNRSALDKQTWCSNLVLQGRSVTRVYGVSKELVRPTEMSSHFSQPRPRTWVSSSSVNCLPVVKYPD